jgi:hypothetical protein
VPAPAMVKITYLPLDRLDPDVCGDADAPAAAP